MLYEHKFETRTKGLICGPAILYSNTTLPALNLINPNPRKNTFLNNKELNISDSHIIDELVRKNNSKYVNTWKISIRSKETKENIWVRPFFSKREAFLVWCRLIGIDLERIEQQKQILDFPTYWIEDELEYQFATVTSYTSGSSTFTVPIRVNSVEYLVVAGGGAGGLNVGGGGGAGGYRTGFLSVTPGSGLSVSVGAGGVGTGSPGSASTFSTITSAGGGYGGSWTPYNGGSGGSGGGGFGSSSSPGGAGNTPATSPSQGNNGGQGGGGSGSHGAGGGGGASAAGGAGAPNVGGVGGNGTSSSISGSSVARAGGGGGGNAPNSVKQPGGTGGGGAGGASDGAGNAGTTNTGGGGGGGSGNNGGSGPGGSGIVILSYDQLQNVQLNMPILGM